MDIEDTDKEAAYTGSPFVYPSRTLTAYPTVEQQTGSFGRRTSATGSSTESRFEPGSRVPMFADDVSTVNRPRVETTIEAEFPVAVSDPSGGVHYRALETLTEDADEDDVQAETNEAYSPEPVDEDYFKTVAAWSRPRISPLITESVPGEAVVWKEDSPPPDDRANLVAVPSDFPEAPRHSGFELKVGESTAEALNRLKEFGEPVPIQTEPVETAFAPIPRDYVIDVDDPKPAALADFQFEEAVVAASTEHGALAAIRVKPATVYRPVPPAMSVPVRQTTIIREVMPATPRGREQFGAWLTILSFAAMVVAGVGVALALWRL